MPGEKLMGRAQYGYLVAICIRTKSKKHPTLWVCLFIGFGLPKGLQLMMYVVSSHHMSDLLEVQDDTFDITYQATPVVKQAIQHLPACKHQHNRPTRAVTKAHDLDYRCTGKSQCRKVTGQFLPLHIFAVIGDSHIVICVNIIQLL